METSRKQLIEVKAKCQCGHLNVRENEFTARMNNKCENCHTYLSFDDFKYENGVSINKAIGNITCACGNTFKGQSWMRDCPSCWKKRVDAKKSRING